MKQGIMIFLILCTLALMVCIKLNMPQEDAVINEPDTSSQVESLSPELENFLKPKEEHNIENIEGIGGYDKSYVGDMEVGSGAAATPVDPLSPGFKWSDREVSFDEYKVLLSAAEILLREKYDNDSITVTFPVTEEVMEHWGDVPWYEVIDGTMLLRIKMNIDDNEAFATVRLHYENENVVLIGIEG